MKYKAEDKLKFIPLLMYGLQWWIVATPSIIVMGLVVAKMHFGTDLPAQVLYMQKLFLLVGITMFAQIVFGHRLPVVTGPASVLLIGILASVSSGVSAIYTAVFVGGAIITLLALSGFLKYMNSIFTTKVIIVIMLLIPFTLMPTIQNLIFQDNSHAVFNLLFSLLFVLALMLTNKLLKGVWKSTTLIWGIITGTLITFTLHGFTFLETPNTSFNRDLSYFISFDFDAGVILSFLFCAIVLVINEVGSIQAVGRLLNTERMSERNKKGVFITGISNMISGLTGIIGSVDYTTSTGIISATRCASIYPFIPASFLLIACSFFPSLIGGLLMVPSVVMGTVLLYIMTMQLTAGLQMIVTGKTLNNFNDGLIIALPLMVAIVVSFTPKEVLLQIPSLFRSILGNGFVMGVITVMIMEHFVFKNRLSE